jgi:hypothetical protein
MSYMSKMKVFLIGFALLSISMQMNLSRSKSTIHFRMQYEKGIQEDEIRYTGARLESTYAHYTKVFGISLTRTADIYIFKTIGRYRLESQSPILDDGYYRAGRLYLMIPTGDDDRESRKHSIARIVVRAILEQIPSCPEWLKVGYSFMAGRDLDRFGPPVRVNVAQFSDLGEDYNRSVSKKDVKELYAKIAATLQFFIERYGENVVVQMLQKFKTEDSLSEVFETSFNEKMEVIEDAWVKDLESAEQRR